MMKNMRILLTGASSFTGMWFAEKLAEAGHAITAAIRGPKDGYSGLRAERLARLADACEFAWDAPFGGPKFLDLAKSASFDLFCHHAAEVKDYKSPHFDATAAAAANSRNLGAVLSALRQGGCRRLLITGSVFEAEEGAGDMPLRAFSPYGLSKSLTAQIFRFHADAEGFCLGKFVIANPFGPYEEPRFTDYLMHCWKDGKPAKVNTPAYVRDNIPVSLLACAYARFAGQLPQTGFRRFNPSYYAESQGSFAQRFAREMAARLKLDTALDLAEQTEFPEPAMRINTDKIQPSDFNWSESGFWDETASYYAQRLDIAAR